MVARPRPRRRLAPALFSIGLHALAVAALLLRFEPPAPDDLPPIEVEMVQEAAEIAGSAPTAPASAPRVQPPAPEQPGEMPRMQPQAAPAPPAPSPTPAAPEINLGNSLQNRAPLSVTSNTIRPPAPDARYRNRPPVYPPDASSVGAEGTVRLLARIMPSGLPAAVVVVGSSGNQSLDDAARDAVLLWRFTPARADGRAVPFDYILDINFTLGSH